MKPLDTIYTCFRNTYWRLGRTKFTTSGAHDLIAITSPQKNDLCTEELRDRLDHAHIVSVAARVSVHWTYVRYIYQRNSAVQVTGVGFAHARPNKSRTSSKFKMAASILFRGLHFLCERENSVHQPSIVLRTGVQQTCLRTNSNRLRVCVRESQV